MRIDEKYLEKKPFKKRLTHITCFLTRFLEKWKAITIATEDVTYLRSFLHEFLFINARFRYDIVPPYQIILEEIICEYPAGVFEIPDITLKSPKFPINSVRGVFRFYQYAFYFLLKDILSFFQDSPLHINFDFHSKLGSNSFLSFPTIHKNVLKMIFTYNSSGLPGTDSQKFILSVPWVKPRYPLAMHMEEEVLILSNIRDEYYEIRLVEGYLYPIESLENFSYLRIRDFL